MPTENLSGQPLSKKNLAILDEEWKQRPAANDAAAATTPFAWEERAAKYWRTVAAYEEATRQQLPIDYASLNLYRPPPAPAALPHERYGVTSSANEQFALLGRQHMQQVGIPEGDMLNPERRTGASDAAHWTRSDTSTAGSSERPGELVRMEIEPDDAQRRRRRRSQQHRRSQHYQK